MSNERDAREEREERDDAADASDGGDLDAIDDVDEIAHGRIRDDDEQELEDELEVDQVELEELGLVLDDPHQPDDD